MKKSIQIKIPEPCHENWDKMTSANQGRYCNACSKVVVDFSMMSDKEILNHISKANSNICGRVNNDQLNRPIQMPTEPRRISFKYFWSLIISSFLISYKTNAQKIRLDSIPTVATGSLPGPSFERVLVGRVGGVTVKNVKRVRIKDILIKGTVMDESGAPIPFASIIIPDSKSGTITDSSGKFQMQVKSSLLNSKLTASSVGFETVSVDLKNEYPEDVKIILPNLKEELMGAVVVGLIQKKVCNTTMGGVSVGIAVTQSTPQTVWDKLIGRNEIKVFPNPISPGAAVNISFNDVEVGNYKLELYDVSGRLIHQSTVPILSKKQVRNFGGDLSLTPGVYFLNVLNAKNKKVYNGSLLVQ